MEYQTLGRTGLVVSRLGLGSWVSYHYQLGTEKAYELMELAFKRGVNFYDNAEAYAKGEAEKIMGASIRMGLERGTWTRAQLVVTTKIFFGTGPGHNAKGLSRKHIIEGAKASLERLGLAYVDVIYAHRPDPVTPIEEIVRAFNFLIDHGMAYYWGTSEWSARDIEKAIACADKLGMVRPCVEQPEYSLVARQRVEHEFAPLYRDHGLGLTTWSPLASGVLTGKYSGRVAPAGSRLTVEAYKFLLDDKFGDSAWQIDVADALAPLAVELGCSMAQLAIAWCLKNSRVSCVLLGATTTAQLEENLDAVNVVPKLTDALMARIAAIAGRAAPVRSKVEVQVHDVRSVDAVSGEHVARPSWIA